MMDDRESGLLEKAKHLAARAYKVAISVDELSNGETVYVVDTPELPGCMAHGETLEEALKELDQVRVDFIYYMLVDGLAVPDPIVETETVTGIDNRDINFTLLELYGFERASSEEGWENDEYLDHHGQGTRGMSISMVTGVTGRVVAS